MSIVMEPIGVVHTEAESVPRYWSVSDVKGELVIDEKYREGLKNMERGQRIVVIFSFHKSPGFVPEFLSQQPPTRNEKRGIFSTCSPRRPNPIGMSVLEILRVEGNVLHVQGLDMLDGTPILDIKPYKKN